MTFTLHREWMNDAFQKWHVGGLPHPAALHRFTAPDQGDPHDHPWGFTSHVLFGGYVEEVFTIGAGGGWSSETVTRLPGTVHQVAATHIHRIISLPAGECWTMIVPGQHKRVSRFWRFGEQVESRAWHENEWMREEELGE